MRIRGVVHQSEDPRPFALCLPQSMVEYAEVCWYASYPGQQWRSSRIEQISKYHLVQLLRSAVRHTGIAHTIPPISLTPTNALLSNNILTSSIAHPHLMHPPSFDIHPVSHPIRLLLSVGFVRKSDGKLASEDQMRR